MQNMKSIDINTEKFLNEHFDLPPLPQCVVKMQEIINKPDVSIERVCELLVTEPVLTTRVLKIVNSAYYGFRREIDDIKFAVAYLGIHEIYNMVISLSVVKNIGIEDPGELDHFWNHSVMTAICAKHLARKFEPLLSPERIWLGGLLHDIGKLVYLKYFPDQYRQILAYMKKGGHLFTQGEKKFGYPESHKMGSLLCERWRLPIVVKDACEGHRLEDLAELNPGSRGDFRRIVCAANLMAILVIDELNNETKQAICDRLKDAFSLDEKEFLKLMGEVYDLKLDLAKYEWA